MKTTLDIPDSIYREFKVKTAMNGEKIRTAVISFIVAYNADEWQRPSAAQARPKVGKPKSASMPEWAGLAAPFITKFPEAPLDVGKMRDDIVKARKAGLA